ncbi:uncharacterized protein LOC109708181 [Ananas comosus]|uniref:Uncharacterized protein LOC109708181 n=1 Tax=Ananas comosus TaxID=4615 RepID=A0A6P5EW79_ANACO|nr:uncharacterized protein LOC109708181 [Ananas comosus]
MAGRSSRAAAKHAHRLFTPGPDSAGSVFAPGSDEFDESDVVWGSPAVEPRKPAGSARTGRKKTAAAAAAAAEDRVTAAASVPVSIPDWSKILREEEHCGGETRRWEVGEDDEEWGEGAGAVIPPHELLDRNRAASFSVHEGVGRTLKGRDLSRVRNAIWEKTGFQD